MQAFLRSHPLRLVALLVLVASAALSTVAPDTGSAQSENQQVNDALAWLTSQQIDNGGFSGFGGEADAGTTADVVYAFVAAGVDPETVTSAAGNSPLDYLRSAAADATATPGLAGKIALALIAAGEDARDVDGLDLIAAIQDGINPDTGFYGDGTVNHVYAMLALSAAGEDVDAQAIDALTEAQIDDGSWSFTGGTESGTGDSNSTALAIQALVAADGDADAVEAGIAYILSLQDDSGAIAYDASEAPDISGDANSTALAIQALLAAGEEASAQIEALSTFQNESGAFFWRADFSDDSLLATAQAVPALQESPLPIEPLAPAESAADDQESGSSMDEALQAAEPAPGCDYFEITSHNLCGSFAEFWTVNGGLMMFGYPMSEEFVDENGRTVQLFERARFELHPELAGTPYHVLLGRLGAEHIEHATNP